MSLVPVAEFWLSISFWVPCDTRKPIFSALYLCAVLSISSSIPWVHHNLSLKINSYMPHLLTSCSTKIWHSCIKSLQNLFNADSTILSTQHEPQKMCFMSHWTFPYMLPTPVQHCLWLKNIHTCFTLYTPVSGLCTPHTSYIRHAKLLGTRLSGWLHLVLFAGPQCGTCYNWPLWHL